MKPTLFHALLSGVLLYLTSCAGNPAAPAQGGDAPEAEQDADEDDERKKLDLAFDIEIAGARLEITRLEQAAFEQDHARRLSDVQAEYEMVKADLAHFEGTVAPNRLASEMLSLRSTKDRAKEAKEELEQIEIMYKDQDLDDLTAEFVVSRGRRNAERAQARIEIQEKALAGLKKHELPYESRRLRMRVESAAADVESAKRDGKIQHNNKKIAVREASAKVEKLERELAELEGDQD